MTLFIMDIGQWMISVREEAYKYGRMEGSIKDIGNQI